MLAQRDDPHGSSMNHGGRYHPGASFRGLAPTAILIRPLAWSPAYARFLCANVRARQIPRLSKSGDGGVQFRRQSRLWHATGDPLPRWWAPQKLRFCSTKRKLSLPHSQSRCIWVYGHRCARMSSIHRTRCARSELSRAAMRASSAGVTRRLGAVREYALAAKRQTRMSSQPSLS